MPKHYQRGDDTLTITEDIDKSRYTRAVPLTPRALRVLDEICPDEGLIFRRFGYRRILVQAACKVLTTEREARHLSALDLRHAALTHIAAVAGNFTAIGHVAGQKSATATALYVRVSRFVCWLHEASSRALRSNRVRATVGLCGTAPDTGRLGNRICRV
jgi:integrase